jgi:hypothetical protein
MNDVPLIQKADINSINTSIIAIKKQLKQLNEALGLVDVPNIDTSVFVKKSDVVDVVESGNMNPVTSNAVAEVADSLEPVDTVTSGNMQSVTSNAVYAELKDISFGYYDANTNRTVVQNRINAIKAIIQNGAFGKMSVIRYNGGYYYSYIILPKIYSASASAIVELNPHDGQISIFKWGGADYSITFVKTFS